MAFSGSIDQFESISRATISVISPFFSKKPELSLCFVLVLFPWPSSNPIQILFVFGNLIVYQGYIVLQRFPRVTVGIYDLAESILQVPAGIISAGDFRNADAFTPLFNQDFPFIARPGKILERQDVRGIMPGRGSENRFQLPRVTCLNIFRHPPTHEIPCRFVILLSPILLQHYHGRPGGGAAVIDFAVILINSRQRSERPLTGYFRSENS